MLSIPLSQAFLPGTLSPSKIYILITRPAEPSGNQYPCHRHTQLCIYSISCYWLISLTPATLYCLRQIATILVNLNRKRKGFGDILPRFPDKVLANDAVCLWDRVEQEQQEQQAAALEKLLSVNGIIHSPLSPVESISALCRPDSLFSSLSFLHFSMLCYFISFTRRKKNTSDMHRPKFWLNWLFGMKLAGCICGESRVHGFGCPMLWLLINTYPIMFSHRAERTESWYPHTSDPQMHPMLHGTHIISMAPT